MPLRDDDPDWELVHEVRDAVARQLEALRNAGKIRGSLDAELVLYAQPELAEKLSRPGDELRFLFLTSDARVAPIGERPAGATALEGFEDRLYALAEPTTHPKCARCWHRRADVGSDAGHPEICGRCATNVAGEGEHRQWA